MGDSSQLYVDYTRDQGAEEVTSNEPTCFLRWQDGVLQQRWNVTTYRDGRAVALSQEWRDIPESFRNIALTPAERDLAWNVAKDAN